MDVERLRIKIVSEGRKITLYVGGELDYSTASTFRRELKRVLDGEVNSLIVNLRDVTFIDSEGIKVILAAASELHSRNSLFGIRECSEPVLRVFRILGFEHYLDTFCLRGQT